METSICGTCRHFVVGADKKQGACRAHPPVLHLIGMRPRPKEQQHLDPTPITISLWPGVTSGSSCGEHLPRST